MGVKWDDQLFTKGIELLNEDFWLRPVEPVDESPVVVCHRTQDSGQVSREDARGLAMRVLNRVRYLQSHLTTESPDVREVFGLLSSDQGRDLVGKDIFCAIEMPQRGMCSDIADMSRFIIDHLDFQSDIAVLYVQPDESFVHQ